MENQITSRGFYLLIGFIFGVCVGFMCLLSPKTESKQVETSTSNVVTQPDSVVVKK